MSSCKVYLESEIVVNVLGESCAHESVLISMQAIVGGSAQCLKSEWVWDSLKQRKKLPIEKYIPS